MATQKFQGGSFKKYFASDVMVLLYFVFVLKEVWLWLVVCFYTRVYGHAITGGVNLWNVNGLPVEAFESLFSFSLSPGGLEDGGHGTREMTKWGCIGS